MSGRIEAVGIGPGGYEGMTVQAARALADCDVIIGYTVYVELIREHFEGKRMLSTPMRQEKERCILAFEEAEKGQDVAMICSGDAGVYGMAGLLYELRASKESWQDIEIEGIPGVTAAVSGAALLGAPLMGDFAVISLSDLLVPWNVIEKRLRAASEADMVICLYNPGSHKRRDHLKRACKIMMEYKSPDTVCGITENIGREGQSCRVLSLKELEEYPADMFTTVFAGNSGTSILDGRMVTNRGYII